MKEKIDEFNHIKIKVFYNTKRKMNRVKNTAKVWRKAFTVLAKYI